MKAVQLIEPGRLEVTDASAPAEPPAGQARVRIRHIGICGTDLHAYRGRQTFFEYPRILGHELGVEIESLGPDDGSNAEALAPGDVCCVEPYLFCGHCRACRHGKPNCCHNLQVLGVHVDGGMCEWLNVPVTRLHRSHRLRTEQLALVEPLCIGAHAMDRAELQDGETVLVVGCGPIGLATVQAALLQGATVRVVDVSTNRLAFCRSQYDVADAVTKWDVPPTDDRAPDVVFDCTGNPEAMMQSFEFAAHGGRLVLVGHYPGDLTFSDASFHRRELTVLASRNAEPDDFARIINLMENGRINVDDWISHRTTLDDLPQQFPTWLDPAGGTIKAVVSVA